MKITAIAAMTSDGGIGIDNKSPFNLPEDLQHFKKETLGKTVVMGRKTFESIGKALPGRTNIVLTNNEFFMADDVVICHSVNDVLANVEGNELMIIGGGQVYNLFQSLISKWIITTVRISADCDTYLELDLNVFKETNSSSHQSKSGLIYAITTLERMCKITFGSIKQMMEPTGYESKPHEVKEKKSQQKKQNVSPEKTRALLAMITKIPGETNMFYREKLNFSRPVTSLALTVLIESGLVTREIVHPDKFRKVFKYSLSS